MRDFFGFVTGSEPTSDGVRDTTSDGVRSPFMRGDEAVSAIRALERKTDKMYERLIAAEYKIAELRAALHKYTEWLD